MLTRRGFLAGLAAAFVADPERLLWTKSKTISIAAPRIIAPDPTEIVLKATARYTHQRYGLGVRISKQMLEDMPDIERRMMRDLERAMRSTLVPFESWTVKREVSVDRDAIQRRFCQAWLLPAKRLPA